MGCDSAMLLVSSYEPACGCVAARCGSSQYPNLVPKGPGNEVEQIATSFPGPLPLLSLLGLFGSLVSEQTESSD